MKDFQHFLRDGRQTFTRPIADYVDVLVLVAGVSTDYVIPATCVFIVLNGTAPFRVSEISPAAIPVADVTDGTASEISPSALRVKAGATIAFISDVDCHVSIACYAGPAS